MRRLWLWDWLVRPHPRLTDGADRRNARLFSSITLVHITLVVFFTVAMNLIVKAVDGRTIWGDQDLHVILAGTALLGIAFGLLRAGFYRAGVLFYILDNAAVALLAPFVPDPYAQIGLLSLAVLPILFAVMGGLSYRESLGILVLTIAIGALQLSQSTRPFPQVFTGITLLIVVSIVGCILLVFRRQLSTLEQDRRAQLEQSAAALQESQERLQTILQSLPTGIVIVDADTRQIVDANPQALQLIGADKDQAVGVVCHRLICPAEQGRCPVLDLGQEVDSSERVLLNVRGEAIPILKTVVPIQLDGQRCLLESFIDITARKQTGKALRESEERYRTLVQASPNCIFVLQAGHFVLANPAAEGLLGYAPGELLGMPALAVIHPDSRELIASRIRQGDRNLPNPTTQVKIVRRDGATLIVESTSVQIELGGQPALLVFGQDITERQQAEEALRRYAAELETRNQELDAFAHTVAHDLKNPVSIITGFAELLSDTNNAAPPETVEESLRTVLRNSRKLYSIIENLLLLAGVRKRQVAIEPLNMASIVHEVLERLALPAQEKQAVIAWDGATGWPRAAGYAPWVEQVWVNYIGNALKYGGQPPHIRLGATPLPASPPQAGGIERGMVRFWIQDNGPGLTPEQQSKLFAPFERLEQTRGEGHGLGLSIVRRIVEKLGGQIGVESQVGQGSMFYFTLPAATGEPALAAHTAVIEDTQE